MHGLSCFTLLWISNAFSCTDWLVSHCCVLQMPVRARTSCTCFTFMCIRNACSCTDCLCFTLLCIRNSFRHGPSLLIPLVTLSQVSYSCPYFSVLIVYSRLLRLSPPPLLLNISQTNLSRVSNPIDRLYHVSYCQGYDGKAGVSIKTA